MQVFLFHEEPDEKTIQPGEQVPIQKAKVIADDIVAIVGELDALALAFAAPLPFEPAEKDLPRHQLKLLESSEEFGTQQGLRLGFGHVGYAGTGFTISAGFS